MSAPKAKVSIRRLRLLRTEAEELTDAKMKAEEAILVFIYEAKQEGASNAAVAAMFPRVSASGIAAKAEQGKEILERKGVKSV